MNRISDVEISDVEEDFGLSQLSTANNNGLGASGSGVSSSSGLASGLVVASGSGVASGSSGGDRDHEGEEASVEGMQLKISQ